MTMRTIGILIALSPAVAVANRYSDEKCAEARKVMTEKRPATNDPNEIAAWNSVQDRALYIVERCDKQDKARAEEEARRIAERKEAEERASRDGAMRKDRKAMATIFGAQFCLLDGMRKTFLDEIAKEKKYARIGGVESRTRLYALQQQIRAVDELVAKERKTLREYPGLVPVTCKSLDVKAVLACRLAEEDASFEGKCTDDVARERARFVSMPGEDDE
jgi:hypothetical protein